MVYLQRAAEAAGEIEPRLIRTEMPDAAPAESVTPVKESGGVKGGSSGRGAKGRGKRSFTSPESLPPQKRASKQEPAPEWTMPRLRGLSGLNGTNKPSTRRLDDQAYEGRKLVVNDPEFQEVCFESVLSL